MNRKSRYNIKIDFSKSKGSYIFNKNNNQNYLDFFGQYSTLTLGYNHDIFNSKEYSNDILKISHQKIVNNEIASDEALSFDEEFKAYTSIDQFHYYHYACTGALAIEAAIKTALDFKKNKRGRIITFKGSFHGINGYGGIVTDRFKPVNERLDGFPGSYWKSYLNPTVLSSLRYGNKEVSEKVNDVLNKVKKDIVSNNDVSGILVEPIQCTYGDHYFTDEFFEGIRQISSNYNIPLIFDEVQTGFGATGKKWYFENLNIVPDILVFGKKTQLSGIMVNKNFGNIFEKPIRLEVTWDADLIDMVRCKYVIRAYKKYNILKNVIERSNQLVEGLKRISNIKNVRNAGLLVAFDFETSVSRDKFVEDLYRNNMIVNPTKDKTIRLRPSLAVKASEIDTAIDKFEHASKAV